MLDQHLVNLLLKLAVSASLASILLRSSLFCRMLLREQRTVQQRLLMAVGFATIFGAGAAARILTNNNYAAADLSLEGSLLAGVLGGYVTGLTGGVLISLPAMLHGESLSMVLLAGVGVLGGFMRDVAPNSDEIWRFSPFFDVTIYRLMRRKQESGSTIFQLFMALTILFAEFLRGTLGLVVDPKFLFRMQGSGENNDWLSTAAVYVTTVFCVGVPLKIWNNTRNEMNLEAQSRLLNESRLRALTSQINPHFLFNTLNSISSLVRTNPEQARTTILRLSSILRRLLRKNDNVTPLRDELSFIDDYLSIEMVRFGEKLKFIKEIDPLTLDRLVPSMLLQPIVENSIKHGLAKKLDGGTIWLRSRLVEGNLEIVIEDNGVGIDESKLENLFEQGIGVSNVNERLKVLFGGDYRMYIDSKPGHGTRTQLEIPDLSQSWAVRTYTV